MGLGDNIARLRKGKGWTQKKLAEEAGLSRGYINAVERGRKAPGLKTLAVIAQGLGVDVEKLTEGEKNNA